MKGLKDRVILVAGAATGIGAASAMRLAREGAKVVVGDLNIDGAGKTAHLIREAGGTAIAMEYDQADEDSIARLVAKTVEQFGSLGGMHANAADLRPEIVFKDGDLFEMDTGVWERTLRVNLVGYALLARQAIPHLIDAGGGGIVLTSSDASAIGEPVRPAYAASKAGINALGRHIASRWGKEGIRCNVICPGLVLTEKAKSSLDPAFLEQTLVQTRCPRLGKPDDIAAAAAFLLSDDAEWVNGQVWSVNGGVFLRD